jgi:hypothetical protein
METTTEVQTPSRKRPLGTDGKPVSPKRIIKIREDHIVGTGSGSIVDQMTDEELTTYLESIEARSYSEALRQCRKLHKLNKQTEAPAQTTEATLTPAPNVELHLVAESEGTVSCLCGKEFAGKTKKAAMANARKHEQAANKKGTAA